MKRLIDVAASLVVIAGIPLFFVQVVISRNAEATQNTVEYVERFNTEPLLADKILLVDMWNPNDLAIIDDFEVSSVVLNKLVRDVVETTPGAEKSLLRLREFRRELGICLETCLCNQAAAKDFVINEYFVEFDRVYGEVVREIEKKYLLNPTALGELTEKEAGSCSSLLHRWGLR